jgi:hypothetical protein
MSSWSGSWWEGAAYQASCSGYYNGSSFYGQGVNGLYWSSTQYPDNDNYGAYIIPFQSPHGGGQYIASYWNRDYYNSVRCYR